MRSLVNHSHGVECLHYDMVWTCRERECAIEVGVMQDVAVHQIIVDVNLEGRHRGIGHHCCKDMQWTREGAVQAAR